MANKITCTCGHSWNKSDSSKKDASVCHICGKDNTMKNGGWLDKLEVPEAQNGIEGTMGGLTDVGFNYNGAWGGPSMAMGGSLPGSVGFTYARIQGSAPANGKYTKKTKASAQNGAEMSFYQNGLDWKPRNISRDGAWLDKYDNVPKAQVGTMATPLDFSKPIGTLEGVSNVMSAPARTATYLLTGKYQDPSQALGIKNPVGAFAADMVLDPINLLGVGVASKIAKGVKAVKSAKVPIALENTLLNEGINLERTATKAKRVPKPSMDKVDLGNDLVLVNNPSRTRNPESILGKQQEIKSVTNPKTGEYISLKTWKDDAGDIKYYFSANMPSSKIKAGKAYLELEKHIPKGSTIMEPSNSSLSLDSYTNTIKQTKNPKFSSNVEDYISLNSSSVLNKLKNKGDADFGYYKSSESAKAGANEISELLKKYNLPKAKIAPVEGYSIRTNGNLTPAYEIKIPNISLKKLYALLGVTAGGTAIDQKKQGGEIKKDDMGYWNPDNWGEPVEIGSNNITMQGVYEPLLGISDEGDTKMMYPGEDYKFKGKKVTEYPISKNGGWLDKYK